MPLYEPNYIVSSEKRNGEMEMTATTWPPEEDPCRHLNGWYDTIRGFFFDRRVFVCTDCKEIINQAIKK